MNSTEIFETIKIVGEFAMIPLLGMIYSVQGRLSKIEGQFSALYELLKTKGTKA